VAVTEADVLAAPVSCHGVWRGRVGIGEHSDL